jgi:cell division protein DivIC
MKAGLRKNKLLILLSLLFLVWILVLDKNSLLNSFKLAREKQELEAKIEYYQSEIRKTNKLSKELSNNKKFIEKFAREEYLMKKPSEDLYIVSE